MNPGTIDFGNYQQHTSKTAIYPEEKGIEYCTLGLTNKAGEVAGVLKKAIRDDWTMTETEEKMAKEIGDVLWYCSQLCTELGLQLGEVAYANLQKLQDRQARGVLGGSGDDR